MAKIFVKSLDIWFTAKVFEKRNKYVANDLNIFVVA